MKKSTKAVTIAVQAVLGAAAITCIIISMVSDKTTPYLAIGLCCTAIANMTGCVMNRKLKGNENGSAEDRRVS